MNITFELFSFELLQSEKSYGFWLFGLKFYPEDRKITRSLLSVYSIGGEFLVEVMFVRLCGGHIVDC